ncbi:MAG: S9 family peptidase [Anaerolineaceae bacterium]|nr:MAG: S9 family peptidase [Anaerolineaceae bacterium]
MTDEKRAITVDDLYQIINVEDPQISPDGRYVAFVRVTVDRMENTYKRTIWLSETAADTPAPRQITRGGNDMQPRWSPDGETLAFVSARGDKPQIYLLSMVALGGEARQLTSLPQGANSPAWSPDGAQIAFLSALTADERQREDENADDPPADKLAAKHRKERTEQDEKERLDPYRMWRVPYREGTAFITERYAQVYVVPVDETLSGDEARPRRLTDVDANYQPPRWSADGTSLFTGRQADPNADEPFTNMALYRLDVATGDETCLTPDATHTNFMPLPSPDGRWLAFARLPASQRGDMEAITRLSVMAVDGGDVTDLNLTLDRSVDSYRWSADSETLFFTADDRGDTPVFKVNHAGGDVQIVGRGRYQITAIDISADGQVVGVISTPHNPSELCALREGSAAPTALTAFNADWLAEVIVQEPQEITFESPSGQTIQGWYILPVGYQTGEQYPLALNIHGGPRFMWGPSTESMFHEWQSHAARGYVVFYCNPRGAAGYGEAFQRDLHAAWGEVAMDDIMAGVDVLVEQGAVDAERMAITGGSYGGYMTAWIIGHTERFKAAVSQRGVYNLVSFYGTSDVPILISSDYGVEPWEDHALLWEHSPLAYAHQIKTPLLIVHAENDFRVPIEQAEQLFAWVRRATDTPVEMWRYPRDGHELSRSGEPAHRASRLNKMIDWFDRYCQPTPD